MDSVTQALRYLDPAVVSRLKSMELRARLIVEGFITGLHRSPYHGFSVEFAEHRPYQRGDELRHVDWKVYARTERFYIKQYEEETNVRHYVVLDTSSSMRFRHRAPVTKLAYSAYLAAALHYLMFRQRDASGLMAFDETLHTVLPPRSTPGHLRQLLITLERLVRRAEEGRKTAVAATLHEVAERIKRRSMVMVLTDLFDNLAEQEALLKALKHLRYRGHEVILFHILEGGAERRLALPDGPVVFRDMETGEELTLHPGQLRDRYEEMVEAFTERFRRQCREHAIDFVTLDTEQPYDRALLTYLLKRQNLS